MIGDLFNLLFPKVCCSCGQNLSKSEETLCLQCIYLLPRTKYWQEEDNKVAKKLWGRVQLVHCSSYLHFIKEGVVQQMLHQLKYKGIKSIGNKLGNLYAEELITLKTMEDVDFIIPVPLYIKKEKKRGYNQSQMIAEGMSEVFNKPIDSQHLIKTTNTSSQTSLSRWNRWVNQQEKFELKEPHIFEKKHILLVDDVITTGSTIESCIQLFNHIPSCRTSAVFVASAL
ncbi:MAG: ComF family protein [Bacteroidetes bacterium]|nr:ComF family protein [Bacteroidota bacterium]